MYSNKELCGQSAPGKLDNTTTSFFYRMMEGESEDSSTVFCVGGDVLSDTIATTKQFCDVLYWSYEWNEP